MDSFFLAKVYPGISRYLIGEVLKAVDKLSIVMILAPFVTFAAKILRKGPAVLLTEGMQNLRLNGFLTLVATTYGRLGELITLTRYPKQMRQNGKKFDMRRAKASWIKMRDLRHTLIQYLFSKIVSTEEKIKHSEEKRTCDIMWEACTCSPT